MADTRKRYTLTLAGIDHTVLLSDSAASRYGHLAKLQEPAKSEQKSASKGKKSDAEKTTE